MLEWKTGDRGWDKGAEEWEPLILEAAKSPKREKPASQRRRWVIIVLGAVIALIAGLGLGLKWQASRNLAAAKADVQATIDQEAWALETGNWELYATLLDRRASALWYSDQRAYFVQFSRRGAFAVEITDLALVQPDLVLVEVRVDPPGRLAYRETRTYRRVENRWRRTAPRPGELWVNPAVHETANLRFVYHPDDAERLGPLFPALQTLYTRLLNDFNLTPLPGKRELQIILSVQPADVSRADPSLRYDLSSLAATADVEQLQRELGRQLTAVVLRQFYQRAGDMAFLLDGVREWEVSTWMGEPDGDVEARIIRVLRDKPFIPLQMVQPAYFDEADLEALTETVVAYLVQRKGQDAVKLLLRGIEQYDGWPRLIEDGVGIPYREAADGWWHFVAQRYAPAVDRSPDAVWTHLDWMLQLEKHAFETRDQKLFLTLLDPQASSAWRSDRLTWFWRERDSPTPMTVRDWGYKGDVAWVVLDRTARGAEATWFPTELRLFRFVGDRWYLTTPELAFPGPALIARTQYFEFRYREPDADLIWSVMSNTDALYEQVLDDLGIAIEPPRRLLIELVYVLDSGFQVRERQPMDIWIPSPQLFREFEIFRLNLGFAIANALLTKLIETRDLGYPNPLLYGIVMWEVEQWGEFPTWKDERNLRLRQLLAIRAPLSASYNRPSVLGVTLIEYVVQTYGRHRLADLVQAAREHQRLQELIPSALGVDFPTFEAGWRSYLERTYGSRPR